VKYTGNQWAVHKWSGKNQRRGPVGDTDSVHTAPPFRLKEPVSADHGPSKGDFMTNDLVKDYEYFRQQQSEVAHINLHRN
jgi:hypothetical protein